MIHCYPGPMASSKTDLLIDAYHRYPVSQALAFNPASNTREDEIRSRNRRSIPSIRFERYGDIARRVYESRSHIRAVIVDENHMAARARGGPEALEALVYMLASLGIDGYFAYLNIGHHGHEQEPSMLLERLHRDCVVTSIARLKSVCSEHGAECPEGGATYSWLIPDLEHAIPGHLRDAEHPDGVYLVVCHSVFWGWMRRRIEDRAALAARKLLERQRPPQLGLFEVEGMA
jgi:thymidine kinase